MKLLRSGRCAPIALLLAGTWGAGVALSPVSAASTHAAKSQTFQGQLQETRHGPIQVSIAVKSKTIVDMKTVIDPNSDGRSPFLQQHAVPILRKEVLEAQGAKIDEVSGATETSDAFIVSLQSAIKKARAAHALR